MRNKMKNYCLSKIGARLEYPFGDDFEVYKVGNKMFALIGVYLGRPQISVKHPKQLNDQLRDVYKDVIPGYHLNKNHWNTIFLDGDITPLQIEEWVDISYSLVLKSLTKKLQLEICNSVE